MNYVWALPEWLFVSLSVVTILVTLRAFFSAVKWALKLAFLAILGFVIYFAVVRLQNDPQLLNRARTWAQTFYADSVKKAPSLTGHR